MNKGLYIYILCLFLGISYIPLQAEGDHKDAHVEHAADDHGDHDDGHGGSHYHSVGYEGLECHPAEYNAGDVAVHHIADANVFSIGPWNLALPCIVYVNGQGVEFFSSGKFKADNHGIGHKLVDGWAIYHHKLMRAVDPDFPEGKVDPKCYGHKTITVYKNDQDTVGTEKEVATVILEGDDHEYILEGRSTLDGGILGGGLTSFYDFSVTKNVMSMILCLLFLAWMFFAIAKSYRKREGKAPKGIQSVIEPIFVFMQEEVSKPILGAKWQKYQPFLMALFFFILALNLFGQIPFFGNANVTGNISVTIALAMFTAIIVNVNGNKHYWGHIFWMPGVPAVLKIFILTPVEIIGVILKPLTLFVRLFGNISAGHMVIIIFVSLIFIFGNAGEQLLGGVIGTVMAIPLTMFMMALELLVAFLQAFVFTILTAVYIGTAIEEHH